MTDADEREGEAVSLLSIWPDDITGVLIGGYAVAAYGQARHSEDLDIAVASFAAARWREWLREQGLTLQRTYRAPDASRVSLEVQRWNRDSLWVDLMSGGIRDRDSGVVIPEDWILEHPRTLVLELLSGRVDHPIQVVRLEGLWATKLLAGRGQDIADLFALSRQPVDIGSVRSLFARVETPKLKRKMESVVRGLDDERLYADTLSRLGLGSPTRHENRRRWNLFSQMVRNAVSRG